MSMYCVRCRRRTGDIRPVMTYSRNGRPMVQAKCSVCGITKSQFVSGSARPRRSTRKSSRKYKGSGVLSDIFGSIF